MNTMKEYVNNWVEDKVSDGYTKQEAIDELLEHGCVSGMVSELIYYSDTLAFYQNHKEAINELLQDLMENTGCSIVELFGDKFEKEDPLCLESNNQNLLAWFGFEETSRLLSENG